MHPSNGVVLCVSLQYELALQLSEWAVDVRKPNQLFFSIHSNLPKTPLKKNPRLRAGVAHPQMTSLISPLTPIRRLSFLPSFSSHFSLRLQRGLHPDDVTITTSSESWYLKVIYTLFATKHPLENYSDFFKLGLTPFNTFHVISNLSAHPQSAFHFFHFTRHTLSLTHSHIAYTFLVTLLSENGLHDLAQSVMDFAYKDGVYMHPSAVNEYLTSLVEFDKLDVAEKFLIELETRRARKGVFHCNVLLNVLVKLNRGAEAVRLFRNFVVVRAFPDTCSFNIVIRGLCRIGRVGEAFEFFNDMGKFVCDRDIFTYNAIIDGLCRVKEVDRARELLEELLKRDDISPDVVTYTLLMSGYCKVGRMKEAVMVFDDMILYGIKPNLYTYNVIIDGFGKDGDMASANNMYEKMLLNGCSPDVITFTCLIDGYCRSCQVEQGLKLWQEMGARNLGPNVHSFCVIIHALCKKNRLSEARDFLRLLKDMNIVPKAFVYNPLIDGYCKSGKVDEANAVVTEMELIGCKHDKITYTILMIGHCMKGNFSEAINIFNKMLAAKCIPDDITVKSVVSCFLKAGMVNEAYHIKKIVSEDLSLELSSMEGVTRQQTNEDIKVAV